jgi:hypothetical protein
LLFHRIYHDSLEHRLSLAIALHKSLSRELRQDTVFPEAFARLHHAAERLAREMTALGMGESCAACAVKNPGGCCSLEMAGETDALQLLMNLLAGVEIDMAKNGTTCCYLGPSGCIFASKPMFCLNYNCDRVIARIGAARPKLERLSAELLGCQYEVEKLLLERLEVLARLPDE